MSSTAVCPNQAQAYSYIYYILSALLYFFNELNPAYAVHKCAIAQLKYEQHKLL